MFEALGEVIGAVVSFVIELVVWVVVALIRLAVALCRRQRPQMPRWRKSAGQQRPSAR